MQVISYGSNKLEINSVVLHLAQNMEDHFMHTND
jgi:hypothetical protein